MIMKPLSILLTGKVIWRVNETISLIEQKTLCINSRGIFIPSKMGGATPTILNVI